MKRRRLWVLWTGTAAVFAVSPLIAVATGPDRGDPAAPRPAAAAQLAPVRHPGQSDGPEPPAAVSTTGSAGGGGGAQVAAGGRDLPAGWVLTGSGPLSPADRDLVVRVRLAGLWEAPVGQQAQQRASSAAVKEVGAHLATEHTDLDAQVRSVAAQLGIELPSQPNAEQQGWMAELSRLRGEEFDRTFVARLRAAHGKVFSILSTVRAGTRNELVRSFAQTAVTVVLRHMTYLEGTGLVDYAALPPPPAPAGSSAAASGPGASATRTNRTSGYLPVVWIVLTAAVVAGAWTTVRVIRPR